MGLDVSHGCFSGPYSVFHRMRIALAKTMYPCQLTNKCYDNEMLELMALAPQDLAIYNLERTQVFLNEDIMDGSFNETPLPSNVLWTILLHYDSHGVLNRRYLPDLVIQLTPIIAKMHSDLEGYGKKSIKELWLDFIEGLERAIELNESVYFS